MRARALLLPRWCSRPSQRPLFQALGYTDITVAGSAGSHELSLQGHAGASLSLNCLVSGRPILSKWPLTPFSRHIRRTCPPPYVAGVQIVVSVLLLTWSREHITDALCLALVAEDDSIFNVYCRKGNQIMLAFAFDDQIPSWPCDARGSCLSLNHRLFGAWRLTVAPARFCIIKTIAHASRR